MFNFSKRLFAYVFSFLFLGIFESSQKSFSFDYLIFTTFNRLHCGRCDEYIQPLPGYKGTKPLYGYYSRTDNDKLVMCMDCRTKDNDSVYMSLINEFYPNFRRADLPNLLNNQSFVSRLPYFRVLGHCKDRYEKCVICQYNLDKFLEDAYYTCQGGHFLHEECAKNLIKDCGEKITIERDGIEEEVMTAKCPICKEHYVQHMDFAKKELIIEQQKKNIADFVAKNFSN